jgi:hypothetical protein
MSWYLEMQASLINVKTSGLMGNGYPLALITNI